MEFKDIVKDPPTRAFLEEHVEGARFLDFVSRRSPVWKEHPLPASKKEAIDLMLQQPNLIRRPVLVQGSRVLFGFDKGQELSEHTASMPAIMEFISGDADLKLGSEPATAQAGSWVYMEPNLPHSVYAKTPVVMLLLLLKNGA